MDLRISTLPTIHGEKVVIRLLRKAPELISLEGIGLRDVNMERFCNLVDDNSGGVILVVGPTGSGKTSTLYAILQRLKGEEINLISLEDPVEYHVDGVCQVQINDKTGLTFANVLRSVLRQDPDIIAVGEIRDGETAEIAMRAAMTGHLVLSTVHTNNAVSSIDRLRRGALSDCGGGKGDCIPAAVPAGLPPLPKNLCALPGGGPADGLPAGSL